MLQMKKSTEQREREREIKLEKGSAGEVEI